MGVVRRTVSQGDIDRMYFKTDNQHQFDGRMLSEADRNECMDQVHNIGRKNTKYMPFPEKKAPLIDRSGHTFSRDFCVKPLGDHLCNREAAKATKSSQLGRVASSPSFENKSAYAERFGGHVGDTLQDAKLPIQGYKMARTKTIGGSNKLEEVASHSHCKHQGGGKPSESVPPRHHLKLTGVGKDYHTTYNQHFTNHLLPTELVPEGKLVPANQVPADYTIFQHQRITGLGPGN